MNFDKRLFLLCAVAVSAAAGAAVALMTRRRHRRNAHHLEHKEQLGSWENEGGNLPPSRVTAASP
ncbi:MAG: hypothetical protein ABI624_13030 [Casimicrobiaceae bacterium]